MKNIQKWLIFVLFLPNLISAQTLQQAFQTPPNAAKPRVWWHWMNGNVTKDGIRKDLLWMHKAGIGGFQNFDAGMATPQIVDKRLIYMTPEWKDAFGYAAFLADSLGLEMAIAGSPGWSESGGPWVTDKDGMKKIVWAETTVKAVKTPNDKKIILPQPPTNFGEFQNIKPKPDFGIAKPIVAPKEYYQDIAVIAYRIPNDYKNIAELNPKISSSAGSFTLEQLTDGDILKTNALPTSTDKAFSWIQFEFPKPEIIKAIKVVGGGSRDIWGVPPPSEERSLEVSDDGVNFRSITFLPLGTIEQQTFSFPAVSAKYFRIVFQNPKPQRIYGNIYSKPAAKIDIAEVVLFPYSKVNHPEDKAGYGISVNLSKIPTPDNKDGINENEVINLTDKFNKEDGTLDWTPPAGNWQIIRFGYSNTGKLNHPASAEATGLEVDKMDARAIRDYFNNYLDQYKTATNGLMGKKGLQYVITDSYECGQANWTPKMAEEFEKRRGYSFWKWLPVLTGTVVKDAASSDQFLWDFRKTISELIAENHYDQLTTILAERDMKRYSESQENGRVFIADGMDVKRTAEVPMSAMWSAGGTPKNMYEADIRESASVAHIYGQNIAAAESFTASGYSAPVWSFHPENLKPTADLEMAHGLNRFVVHTSVHQPVDDKIPGLGLAHIGQWFNRHETWANQASAWTNYLSRSCFMLQQGKFAADIVYYYGEDSNITFLFGDKLPDIPKGYNFDFINADALAHLLEAKNGNLITPSGMSYRILVLDPNSRLMTLKVLRKLQNLLRGGAVIIGPKPIGSPSLNDDKTEYEAIVNELWGGNGKIKENQTIQEALNALKVNTDFDYTKSQTDSDLRFVHRVLPDSDIYWVNNRNNRVENTTARFRTSGKEPEIWHPETGKMEKVSYTFSNGVTTIPLKFEPEDAYFIVFRNNTSKSTQKIAEKAIKETINIEGAWTVNFQEKRGAPATATFDKLTSWTENIEGGIKYFSGTATYQKTFKMGKIDKKARYEMDLGEVKNIAEVILNGKNMGTVWKKPFKLDITEGVKKGENSLEIRVTNLWINRLIGDRQPNATNKITYTTQVFFKADSPLLPSGMLGPVKLERIE